MASTQDGEARTELRFVATLGQPKITNARIRSDGLDGSGPTAKGGAIALTLEVQRPQLPKPPSRPYILNPPAEPDEYTEQWARDEWAEWREDRWLAERGVDEPDDAVPDDEEREAAFQSFFAAERKKHEKDAKKREQAQETYDAQMESWRKSCAELRDPFALYAQIAGLAALLGGAECEVVIRPIATDLLPGLAEQLLVGHSAEA